MKIKLHIFIAMLIGVTALAAADWSQLDVGGVCSTAAAGGGAAGGGGAAAGGAGAGAAAGAAGTAGTAAAGTAAPPSASPPCIFPHGLRSQRVLAVFRKGKFPDASHI